MSSSEWLSFIDPFIVVTMALALIASIPVSKALSERFSLNKKPLIGKKTLVILFIATGIAWLLAWIAPFFATHPQTEVNLIATSQLGLTLSLIAIGIIIVIRVFHKNNCLTLILLIIKRYIPSAVTIFSMLASALLLLFLDASRHMSKHQEELDEENAPYEDPKGFMNYRGDYCDKYKSTWYD